VDTILNHRHNGRIHYQFNQLRSDEGGTVSGRFLSSNPNSQQVPSRHPEIKKLIRGLFLPDEGCQWGRVGVPQEIHWHSSLIHRFFHHQNGCFLGLFNTFHRFHQCVGVNKNFYMASSGVFNG